MNSTFVRPELVPRAPNQTGAFSRLAVVTRGDPWPQYASLRSAVWEVDPRQPIYPIQLATEVYADPVSPSRFLMVVLITLSTIALALAMIGIHGLLSYQIVQRRREIGVRIALGATSRRLWWEVAGEGMTIVLVGSVAGVGIALAAAGAIRGALYGVEPTDSLTFLGALVATLLAGLVACVPPVYRARSTNPAEVLRVE